jgi:O-methyltransferase/methyltransferase family protein
MRDLIAGYWVSRLIYVASRLKLADLLKDGPRTAEQLADAARVQPQLLYRALRTLASYGVFAEIKGRRFKLTPLGATLRTDVQPSMNGFALMLVEKHVWYAWEQLLYAVQTGELPFDRIFGKPFYNYLEDHPDDLKVFGEAMTSLSGIENPAIAAAFKKTYKSAGIRTLVDVAGGHGSLLAAILAQEPQRRAVRSACRHRQRRERSSCHQPATRRTVHA